MGHLAAAVFTGERGRRPIEALGCVFLHNFGKGDVILIGELFPDLLFIFRILRLVSFLPVGEIKFNKRDKREI